MQQSRSRQIAIEPFPPITRQVGDLAPLRLDQQIQAPDGGDFRRRFARSRRVRLGHLHVRRRLTPFADQRFDDRQTV